MLETILRIIFVGMFAILNMCILKDMLDYQEKIIKPQNIILLTVLVIISWISYKEFYSINAILIRTTAGLFIYKQIFKYDIYKLTVAILFLMFITLVIDVTITGIAINVITHKALRTESAIILISNIATLIIVTTIFKGLAVGKKMNPSIKDMREDNKAAIILMYTLIFISTISIFYNITKINTFSLKFVTNTVVIISFITVGIIFIKDQTNYGRLAERYNTLFKYVQTLEDSIDNINVGNHEYKNKLAILKNYIDEGDKTNSVNILNEMIKETMNKDNRVLTKLKKVPKGGIKGLLYYKILIVNKNKINFCIDISDRVIPNIKKLNIEQLKKICNLIGIYFDNAIEGAKESRKKLLSVEIYNLDDDIEFVFCNTMKNKNIDIEKIGSNGYTTKGKGHGRGLYLAKKIIMKNEWIRAETKIDKNLYIQKLIIKNI